MRLYYLPGACSLSPHIALRELGLPFALDRVDLKSGRTQSGETFAEVNPKGYVPALRLDDGTVLTEGPAIVQYLADLKPGSGLAPPAGSLERVRLQELLNHISTELHKTYSPLFNPATDAPQREAASAKISRHLGLFETLLGDGRDHLMGGGFTVADGYFFVVASWSRYVGFSLEPWPKVTAFLARVAQRPAVKGAMEAEGLIVAA